MEQLDDDTVSPPTLRAIVTGLIERQQVERESFLAALGAYRDLTERLSADLADARETLALETDRARVERQQLVKEFLDRVDVLSAKISTSAARFTAELAEKEVLREQAEQRGLAYAYKRPRRRASSMTSIRRVRGDAPARSDSSPGS